MSTAIDPVCNMEVDANNPPGGKSEYRGNTYYFCAPGCKTTFDRDPEKYHEERSETPPQKRGLFSRILGRK